MVVERQLRPQQFPVGLKSAPALLLSLLLILPPPSSSIPPLFSGFTQDYKLRLDAQYLSS